MTKLLDNKLIVVAGGLGRIGKAFVQHIIENGGTAVVADLSEEAFDSFVKDNGVDKTRIFFKPIDITSKKVIQNLIEELHQEHGRIDAFVNTAYPLTKSLSQPLEELSYEHFCESLNIHIGGYFICTQQFTNYFLKQGYGNIVNVSSIQGVTLPKFDTYEDILINGVPMSSSVDYTCNKTALVAMTKYFAKYYKLKQIRFNLISPGGILDGQPDEFLKRYRSKCINKGMLDAQDLNGALLFLLSDASKFYNGQNIVVDDGFSL